MDLASIVPQVAIAALPILFAITLHEVAHGWMAERFGDSTARMLGRITLNPLSHIDLVGTVLIPLFLFVTTGFIFGYAKPVPVNFANLRNPKQDMVWVAGAGPATNLVLAMASGMLLRLIAVLVGWFGAGWAGLILVPIALMLKVSVIVNTILLVINLIPIPPLDGGRIAVGLLPRAQALMLSRLEPYGLIIFVVLIFMNPLGIMSYTLWPLVRLLLWLFGGL